MGIQKFYKFLEINRYPHSNFYAYKNIYKIPIKEKRYVVVSINVSHIWKVY